MARIEGVNPFRRMIDRLRADRDIRRLDRVADPLSVKWKTVVIVAIAIGIFGLIANQLVWLTIEG